MKTHNITSITLAAALTAAATSCSIPIGRTIKASDNIIRKEISATAFNAVEVSHFFDVALCPGNDCTVVITGPDNIVALTDVNVSGSTLFIKSKESGISIDYADNNQKALITVTVPELSSLRAADQSSVSVSCNVSPQFSVSTTDQSAATFNNAVSATKLTANAADQSSLRFKNINSTELSASASDQSEFRAGSIESDRIMLSATDQSSMNAASLSATTFKGLTADQSSMKIGSADVHNGTVAASDQSDINIHQSTGNISSNCVDQASVSVVRR